MAPPSAVADHMSRWLSRGRDDATSLAPSLLVDHWYSHAVGHVVEALRRCLGYHAADPQLRISLVLNGASPIELASCAPFVESVFAVPYTSFGRPEGRPRAALGGIPRDWDYVVHHPAAFDPAAGTLRRAEALLRGLRASLPGPHRVRDRRGGAAAVRAPPELRLVVPENLQRPRSRCARRPPSARRHACRERRARALPVATSWNLVLDELERRFPDAVLHASSAGPRRGWRHGQRHRPRRGRPPDRGATPGDRRLRPPDARAARRRRGVERLRLARTRASASRRSPSARRG